MVSNNRLSAASAFFFLQMQDNTDVVVGRDSGSLEAANRDTPARTLLNTAQKNCIDHNEQGVDDSNFMQQSNPHGQNESVSLYTTTS